MAFVPAMTQEAKEVLASFVAMRINATREKIIGDMPFEAAGIVRDGVLKGAVLYTNYRETSLEIAWAGTRGWATRQALREIFRFAFEGLGVLRVSGVVERSNSVSRNFAARVGAREVGVLDDEFGEGRDGIIYSIKRDKCRWK